MSNDIRGYIQVLSKKNVELSMQFIGKKYGIGIGKISSNKLYNFPESYLPPDSGDNFVFTIGDDAEDYCPSYLIDYLDYAPEADIGFPVGAKERLDILLNVLVEIVRFSNAPKMVIAITDSNQIETIKKIKLSELYAVIHADFEEHQGPPNTIYEIMV